MSDIFCGSERETVHDGKGNINRIHMPIKQRSKNYNAIVRFRTNFENITKTREKRYTMIGAKYTVHI